jgi:hypothetical protein
MQPGSQACGLDTSSSNQGPKGNRHGLPFSNSDSRKLSCSPNAQLENNINHWCSPLGLPLQNKGVPLDSMNMNMGSFIPGVIQQEHSSCPAVSQSQKSDGLVETPHQQGLLACYNQLQTPHLSKYKSKQMFNVSYGGSDEAEPNYPPMTELPTMEYSDSGIYKMYHNHNVIIHSESYPL